MYLTDTLIRAPCVPIIRECVPTSMLCPIRLVHDRCAFTLLYTLHTPPNTSTVSPTCPFIPFSTRIRGKEERRCWPCNLQPAHCNNSNNSRSAVQARQTVQHDLDSPNHNTMIMDSRPSMATCYLLYIQTAWLSTLVRSRTLHYTYVRCQHDRFQCTNLN